MSGVSPVILAASVFLTGGAAFSAGYLMSPPTSHAAEIPIVNPDAWSVQGPKLSPQPVRAEQPRCNPWDVSDIAMEAVLEEMHQRGWRPPGYVERAVADGNAEIAAARAQTASYQSPSDETLVSGNSLIAVVSDADADRMWRDAEQAKVAKVAAESAQLPAIPQTP